MKRLLVGLRFVARNFARKKHDMHEVDCKAQRIRIENATNQANIQSRLS